MLTITNQKLFNEVVETAYRQAADSPRWLRAIERAAHEIEENGFMHWQGDSLLIQSRASSEVYSSNGVCSCRAFEHNQPCYHRAAARLWQRYLEASEIAETETFLAAYEAEVALENAPAVNVAQVNELRANDTDFTFAGAQSQTEVFAPADSTDAGVAELVRRLMMAAADGELGDQSFRDYVWRTGSHVLETLEERTEINRLNDLRAARSDETAVLLKPVSTKPVIKIRGIQI